MSVPSRPARFLKPRRSSNLGRLLLVKRQKSRRTKLRSIPRMFYAGRLSFFNHDCGFCFSIGGNSIRQVLGVTKPPGISGAGGENRTLTSIRTLDFESSASTCSTTPARWLTYMQTIVHRVKENLPRPGKKLRQKEGKGLTSLLLFCIDTFVSGL